MVRVFVHTTKFNQDLGSWNVSKVTDMNHMFYGARKFNQDIGSWNVDNVTNMLWMFVHADIFNQDISGWDVSNVTRMDRMFYNAFAINQDLSDWDISSVTNLEGMFLNANALSGANKCAIHNAYKSNSNWPHDWTSSCPAGTIQGTVRQSNGSALSDVLVSFSGANTDNATTDSSGNFNKTLGLGSYTLTYTKSGYISSTQRATLATDNQTVVVATLTLSSSSCSAGNISGTIKDAVSGSAISGVSLSIRSGANVTSGSAVSGKTATTADNGTYTVSSVDAGGYTVQASKSGYLTSYFNVNVCGNVSNQDSNMSTTLNSGTMRIVTSWKGTDDLDSHLEIPVSDDQDGTSDSTDSTHLFYGSQSSGLDYHCLLYTSPSPRD